MNKNGIIDFAELSTSGIKFYSDDDFNLVKMYSKRGRLVYHHYSTKAMNWHKLEFNCLIGPGEYILELISPEGKQKFELDLVD